MGDPKLPRRMWRKPKRPFNYDLKMEELRTLGTFGLRTKRELWKAHTELSRVRNQARSLLALGQEVRERKEPVLLRSLARIGLVGKDASLDDVLNLQVNDLLGRRLQTIVMKKLGFSTPYQARQAVVHGHITISDRVVTIPSYTVYVEEEGDIKLTGGSAFATILEKSKRAEAAAREAAAEAAEAEQAAAQAAAPTPAPAAAAPKQ
ncbi:ribosomal protein S4 [Cenarchaeum symbiosum A]|uniref:Small ribosomal subunit protein uS4 n=1 Tax=Cenarchaeum symbiosum (strain A) TaxID=414004 RepID=RS4_CENSY|nr:RecName: Full=Small ribosomal subunit protein uS4; AltName: Full=30S ribosomal protein S4 [Cenarchaeum symbiosum A]ABK78219.1 ribosomal protein S4 [Cenarchaeum symbiosum A]